VEDASQALVARPARICTTLVCDASGPEFLALAQFRPDSCVCVNVLEQSRMTLVPLTGMAGFSLRRADCVAGSRPSKLCMGPSTGTWRITRYRRAGIVRLAGQAVWGLRENRVSVNAVGAASGAGGLIRAHLWKRQAQSDAQIAVFDRLWRADGACGKRPFRRHSGSPAGCIDRSRMADRESCLRVSILIRFYNEFRTATRGGWSVVIRGS